MALRLRRRMRAFDVAGDQRVRMTINQTSGIVTIADANTTIGYCRYTDTGEVEYIFVNTAYRRRGFAKQLLGLVEASVQRRLRFQPPISPLGATLQTYYATRAEREVCSEKALDVNGYG